MPLEVQPFHLILAQNLSKKVIKTQRGVLQLATQNTLVHGTGWFPDILSPYSEHSKLQSQISLLRALFYGILSTSTHRSSIITLSTLFHCLITFAMKNIFPCYVLRTLLAIGCDCCLSFLSLYFSRRVCLCLLCNWPLPNWRQQLHLYSSLNKSGSIHLSSCHVC